MSKRIVASIEARMTSTRLPGKVLTTCLGRPMLELLLERLRRSKHVEHIVVATTEKATDDPIQALTQKLGVGCFRGSDNDVLGRVVGAMHEAEADVIVQFTGDCPLMDAEIIDGLIETYLEGDFDCVTNTTVRSFPRGLDCTVVLMQVLARSLEMAKDKAHHEHVSLCVFDNPEIFKIHNIEAQGRMRRPDLRWTLDTQQDLELIDEIFTRLHPQKADFNSNDILDLLKNEPQLEKINQAIEQKKVR